MTELVPYHSWSFESLVRTLLHTDRAGLADWVRYYQQVGETEYIQSLDVVLFKVPIWGEPQLVMKALNDALNVAVKRNDELWGVSVPQRVFRALGLNAAFKMDCACRLRRIEYEIA